MRKRLTILFSLTGTGEDRKSWTEEFPPMPTKRYGVSALGAEKALIVAGGEKTSPHTVIKTVEILFTSTRQWHTSTDLPQPLYSCSMTVCGDHIYLLGGRDENYKWTNSVYSYPLTELPSLWKWFSRVLSRSSDHDTWTRMADLPVSHSTAVSFHGQLIAIGGEGSNYQPTSNVHRYNPSTNSWEVFSYMATPRSRCLAAVLPDNQLMIIGGFTRGNIRTNSVEFVTAL